MKLALVVAGLLAAAYIAVAGLVFFKQRSIIYYPQGEDRPVVPGFELVQIRTHDGLDLVAGFRPASEGRPTFLAFHGNAADWQSMALGLQPLVDEGFGVLSMPYRGYRGRPGKPTEQDLYRDGRAALGWLKAQGVPDGETIAIGNSLGSGIAVQLASERKLHALVLVSPLASISRLVPDRMRWLPVDLLLRDRFDNLAKMPDVLAPTLIVHGDVDRVITIGEGRLLANANPSARFTAVAGAGHDLMYQPQIGPIIQNFLREI